MSETHIKVAALSELPSPGRLSVVINDEIPALLLRTDDGIYCLEDVCTHDGQPMTDGDFDGCELTCPRHGAKFNVKSGTATKMPATEPVRVFDVEVRDDAIYVKFDG